MAALSPALTSVAVTSAMAGPRGRNNVPPSTDATKAECMMLNFTSWHVHVEDYYQEALLCSSFSQKRPEANYEMAGEEIS